MTVMESPSRSSAASKQTVLTGKLGKKIKCQHVGLPMIQKLKTTQKCMDKTEKTAKGFCFSITYQGAGKRISNASVIEMYETAYRGILDHHSVMKVCMKEFSGKTLAPLPECALNKSNIICMRKQLWKPIRFTQLVIFKVKKLHLLEFDA